MDVRIERTLQVCGFTKKQLRECNDGDVVAYETSTCNEDGDFRDFIDMSVVTIVKDSLLGQARFIGDSAFPQTETVWVAKPAEYVPGDIVRAKVGNDFAEANFILTTEDMVIDEDGHYIDLGDLKNVKLLVAHDGKVVGNE